MTLYPASTINSDDVMSAEERPGGGVPAVR